MFARSADDAELYTHYLSILTFYIYTNLEQAILVGSALSAESERSKIPYNIQNDVSFLFGVRS